jgi:hypothetical protein
MSIAKVIIENSPRACGLRHQGKLKVVGSRLREGMVVAVLVESQVWFLI